MPVPPTPTVHHAELLEELHAEFEVTEKVVEPDTAVTFLFAGETASVGTKPVAVKVPIIPIAACGVQT